MRRLMFKAFSGKFLGTHYERAGKSLMVCLIVYWGLDGSGLRLPVAPFILYLIASVHTTAVMWRVLSSQEHAEYLKNMRMLPFENHDFVLTWVCALGIYTFIMQTGLLLSVLWATASFNGMEMLKSIFCAIHAVPVTALVYSRRSRPYAALLWAAISFTCIFLLQNPVFFFPVTAANILVALIFLIHTDADAFFPQNRKIRSARKALRCCPTVQYLIRYLVFHPGYLINLLFLWGIACILPLFFRRMGETLFFPVGFAILSLNTPLGILLSCDPDLEQAVRFLPEQGKRFCLPYGFFVALCNLIADTVFLCSWRILNGPVPLWASGAAALFSFLSAAGTVALEWFCPIRNWKTESDLWHHPRKYAVPIVLLLAAGVFCFRT